MRATITAILAVAFLGPALTAQRTPHTRPQPRWEIGFTVGRSSGGSAPAIATAMAAGGLNSTLPAGCFVFWCWNDIHYPVTNRGARTTTVALGYRVRPWFTLLLQRSSADLGQTTGYLSHQDWMTLRQRVTSTSALAVVNFGVLHAGVGPAVQRLAVIREENDPVAVQKRTRIGVTVDAGLTVPAHTLLFVEARLQYQLVGSMAFGPLAATDPATTMARTEATFNYHTLKLGMGLRL